MSTSPEKLALDVVRRLQAAGHTAYFAGGCVRDRLMGRVPKDFDVATSARPEQVLGLFPRSQKVGVAFGVVLVRERFGGKTGDFIQVEVATFRADGTYSDGRHPDAVRFTTPQEDAQRRDFTCNGLFFDPVKEEVHDYVGGRADIERRVLRAIGDAEARFAEDHLRMLRAVRFAAKLGFEIEAGTRTAIKDHVFEIQKISAERIGEEMRMMLEHPARAMAVQTLSDTALLYQIWPDIWRRSPDAWNTIGALAGDVSRAVGLAAIQVDLWEGDMPRPWGRKNWLLISELLKGHFVLSNDEEQQIAWIGEIAESLFSWKTLSRARLKRAIAHPQWSAALQLHQAWSRDAATLADLGEKIAQMKAEGAAPPPLVTGETLIKLGAAPGPQFRGWIDSLYDRQLENEFQNPEQAINAARQLIDQSSPKH
ncbi:MAG TPA: CCA tRNA nucleotidyltransferase [Phycisphaerae bacterium]|nr:CCA tRNA nucleotidyltransferase [Phycisphaerae bacterium]